MPSKNQESSSAEKSTEKTIEKNTEKSTSRSETGKNTRKSNKTPEKSKQTPPCAPQDTVRCQVTQFVLGLVAALLLLILLLTDLKEGSANSATGLVGYYLCLGLYGLFGWGVWVVPAALIYLTVFWRRAIRDRKAVIKVVLVSLVVLVISGLCFYSVTLSEATDLPAFYNIFKMWSLAMPKDGTVVNVGGIFGALFGGFFNLLFRKVTWPISLLILGGALVILSEIPPIRAIRAIVSVCKRFFSFIGRTVRSWMEDRKLRKEASDKPGRDEDAEEDEEEAEAEDEAEEDVGSQVFPGEIVLKRSKKNTGNGRKSVQITPVDYAEGKGGKEISDPPITDTIPPVLPAGQRRPEPEPYHNPYADSRSGQQSASPATREKANPDLFDKLFPDGLEDGPLPGSADVNVRPRRPAPADEFESSGDPIPVTARGRTPGRVKTTDQRFDEISDLQKSDENDHALTDPDLAEPDEIELRPAYKFPPLTLLKKDTGGMNADHSDELRANGVKLVNVLESFKVKTKITNISRGPTITRYELLPDQGVRVRSIANLVDDIALNLATSGVRIEAPIPGKPAVGIEVPNATKETVYLRDLLENPKFAQAGSKVTAALGMDVAGEPIFADIAKMPHLLIAGTTGSGKSVCMNTLITSLLFRATPDEVKLILIDPKKVELGVYNGLPHLLVPVVTQPKKAAGALTWAVSEMERRYEAIEQAGVRDNKGYNKLIEEGKLEGEKMPSIVIVIDELADLMMTAPDTVEESICRLAQKARAAGMHLIIGTQRPSVDVITGLIKANIPSRIAFTVKSIVDSRTIIDIGGAEKLIGYGDMLYAPVGAMKPIRVQGAFVSGKEVEEVCKFIKSEVGETAYDQKTIDEIREHEAECEEAGKKGSFGAMDGDDEEEDPKFVESVRLAVESGKISTSLLQRRMGLGYGRAAKIIDRMEQMGIVSAPDGQKPRNVLMNMQEFQEMIMHTKE